MLPLDHPLWATLSCHNITGSEFAAILSEYYVGNIPAGEDLQEDLLQCICGGDVYDSSFAAAPHLVELARKCEPSTAAALLGFAGYAMGQVAIDEALEIAPPLAEFFPEACKQGLETARRILDAIEEGTPEREQLQVAMFVFAGDLEGFKSLLAEIDAREQERIEQWIELENAKPKAIKTHWQTDDGGSWTFNG